ncbi:hypothetical protein [Aquimarina rhabdastrellae]
MLKNILNLDGIKKLEKKQQRAVQGGRMKCKVNGECIAFGRQCAESECAFIDPC